MELARAKRQVARFYAESYRQQFADIICLALHHGASIEDNVVRLLLVLNSPITPDPSEIEFDLRAGGGSIPHPGLQRLRLTQITPRALDELISKRDRGLEELKRETEAIVVVPDVPGLRERMQRFLEYFSILLKPPGLVEGWYFSQSQGQDIPEIPTYNTTIGIVFTDDPSSIGERQGVLFYPESRIVWRSIPPFPALLSRYVWHQEWTAGKPGMFSMQGGLRYRSKGFELVYRPDIDTRLGRFSPSSEYLVGHFVLIPR